MPSNHLNCLQMKKFLTKQLSACKTAISFIMRRKKSFLKKYIFVYLKELPSKGWWESNPIATLKHLKAICSKQVIVYALHWHKFGWIINSGVCFVCSGIVLPIAAIRLLMNNSISGPATPTTPASGHHWMSQEN